MADFHIQQLLRRAGDRFSGQITEIASARLSDL
jgi:hypothetical protein